MNSDRVIFISQSKFKERELLSIEKKLSKRLKMLLKVKTMKKDEKPLFKTALILFLTTILTKISETH